MAVGISKIWAEKQDVISCNLDSEWFLATENITPSRHTFLLETQTADSSPKPIKYWCSLWKPVLWENTASSKTLFRTSARIYGANRIVCLIADLSWETWRLSNLDPSASYLAISGFNHLLCSAIHYNDSNKPHQNAWCPVQCAVKNDAGIMLNAFRFCCSPVQLKAKSKVTLKRLPPPF